MAIQKTAVGVDFGADTIKAVRVRVVGNEARIDSVVSIPRGDEFAREDVAQLARKLRDAMVEAGIPTKRIVLSIDARDSIIRYNHVPPMPASRLSLIMKYEVESIGERMGESLASDCRVLPVMRDDGEQTVLLALAKEDPLTEFLDAFDGAGVTVAAAVPAPLALFGAWDLFATKMDIDSPDDDHVLVVDLGRSGINVALILNNRLVFARSGSFGGELFTEALASEFGISRDDAERLKVARGGLDDSGRGVDDRTVGPLRSTAGQLLGFVQSSIRFGSSQTGVSLPPVTRLWLTGGGARLRGLPEYLSGGLGRKPFEVFDPAVADGGRVSVSVSDGKDGVSEACVGMPLGLSAIGLLSARDAQAGTGVSILPEKYRRQRVFRERTRWLIAAAVVLVAVLVAQFVQGWTVRGRAAETRTRIGERREELDRKVAQRDGWIATSSRTRARINRMLREGEPSAFQAFMLDFFARNLRPEIQLELVNLEVETVENEEAGSYRNRYVLLVRGRANNEKGRAHDWVLDLQSRIKQEERVRDAKVQNTRVERSAWYSFELLIEPQYVSI